jgi:hypothetical protein
MVDFANSNKENLTQSIKLQKACHVAWLTVRSLTPEPLVFSPFSPPLAVKINSSSRITIGINNY